MARAAQHVARTLTQAKRGGAAVTHLELASSPDLVCMNIMCEKLGDVRDLLPGRLVL